MSDSNKFELHQIFKDGFKESLIDKSGNIMDK